MSTADRPIRDLEDRFYDELGLKRLNPAWAKTEIFVGLAVVSAGHLVGVYSIVHGRGLTFWTMMTVSLLCQSLGGYLALAGHRSHVYQSQNKLMIWLAARLSRRDM
jgi:hypothetical protein